MSNSPYRLMVVGGESSRPSIIEYYCPNMKKWRYWKKLPDLRNDYAATVWDNELCICGAEGGCTYYVKPILKSLTCLHFKLMQFIFSTTN